MNRKEINKRLTDLYSQSGRLKQSYQADPEYKKLSKELAKIEKKIFTLKQKALKTHAYQLSEIEAEIVKLKMQRQARTTKVLNPSTFGDEFNKWWLTVFIGVSSFAKKQLMWVSDDKAYCLMKVIRDYQSGVDWYLYEINQTKLIHHTEGRLNAIKLAAMETKIKTKIKLK